jgi:dTDP-L-rhamnose 4-epimerase
VIGDVRAVDVIERALTGVDAVCHLAAKVGLGVDVDDLPDYADVNVSGTAGVLAAMARAGVHRLVLASSMVVYGEGVGACAEHGEVTPGPRDAVELVRGQFEAPCPTCRAPLAPAAVTEDAALDPRNGYAASKVAQEHFAGSWARATGGSVSALRFHNVYGPGMPRDNPYAGVAAIFRSELRNGRAPRVFEDGGQRRDFVHVRDVASATVAALEQHDAGVVAVNVGSGTARTVGELASALSVVTGGPAPIVTGQFRLGDVRHITADSTLLRERFAWRPQVEFADGLAELVAASG